MNSLLPSNSTQLERALEAAFYEKTIVPLRMLYNADTCPEHLLLGLNSAPCSFRLGARQ